MRVCGAPVPAGLRRPVWTVGTRPASVPRSTRVCWGSPTSRGSCGRRASPLLPELARPAGPAPPSPKPGSAGPGLSAGASASRPLADLPAPTPWTAVTVLPPTRLGGSGGSNLARPERGFHLPLLRPPLSLGPDPNPTSACVPQPRSRVGLPSCRPVTHPLWVREAPGTPWPRSSAPRPTAEGGPAGSAAPARLPQNDVSCSLDPCSPRGGRSWCAPSTWNGAGVVEPVADEWPAAFCTHVRVQRVSCGDPACSSRSRGLTVLVSSGSAGSRATEAQADSQP